jgi:hypothetical protein
LSNGCPKTVTAPRTERLGSRSTRLSMISCNRLRPVGGLQPVRHQSANSRLRQLAAHPFQPSAEAVQVRSTDREDLCLTRRPLHSRPISDQATERVPEREPTARAAARRAGAWGGPGELPDARPRVLGLPP